MIVNYRTADLFNNKNKTTHIKSLVHRYRCVIITLKHPKYFQILTSSISSKYVRIV